MEKETKENIEENCNPNCECKEELHDSNCERKDDKTCSNHEQGKKKKDKYADKLNETYNKISELENLLMRSKADLINYRKRKDDEVSRMLKYSNEDLIKEILPTLDNFERAIKLDDHDLNDELSKFLSGFKMIYCNLLSTLESYGVKMIDGNNKLFDPIYHQAVMTDKIEGIESGYIIEVLQKGYLLKDKVIRPAMVKVNE